MKKIFLSRIFINIIKYSIIISIIGLTIWSIIICIPYLNNLKTPEGIEYIKKTISSFEPFSWLILLGIQILQIVIAVIPGEPIEIISGIMYGTFGGLILCLIGILIGSAIVFYLVRWLGKDFIDKFVENKKIEKFKFLSNNKNLELLVGILFFIPGTPKDVLTYIVPVTKIKPIRFFLIATFARIPSVVTSTLAGSKFQDGELLEAVIIFGVTAVIGIFGILLHNYIVEKNNKKNDNNNDNDNDNNNNNNNNDVNSNLKLKH